MWLHPKGHKSSFLLYVRRLRHGMPGLRPHKIFLCKMEPDKRMERDFELGTAYGHAHVT
jgi:hypothetical protein